MAWVLGRKGWGWGGGGGVNGGRWGCGCKPVGFQAPPPLSPLSVVVVVDLLLLLLYCHYCITLIISCGGCFYMFKCNFALGFFVLF